jgi:hypothetical protein
MSDLYVKDPFIVDRFACIAAGKMLSSYSPLTEKSLWSCWDPSKKFAFKLFLIAICHDINWDFLQGTLAKLVHENPALLSTDFLAQISASTVKKWLGKYHNQKRIRAAERSHLLRDLSQNLIDKFSGEPFMIVLESDGTLFGEKGLMQFLDEFEAYREDPLRKKANILVHDLIRERIMTFKDADRIRPAIEYHIMRLYERTGRVVPRDSKKANIDKALKRGIPFTPYLLTAFREKVSEAMIFTADAALKSVPDINYVEWQIARSICIPQKPLCIPSESAPLYLPEDIRKLFSGSCPFISCCAAHSNPSLLKLKEPISRRLRSFY